MQRRRRSISLLEEVQERKRVIMGGNEQSKRAGTMNQETSTNPQPEDYKHKNSCDTTLLLSEGMNNTAATDIPHIELTDDACSLVAKYFTHVPSIAFNTVSTTISVEPATTSGKILNMRFELKKN